MNYKWISNNVKITLLDMDLKGFQTIYEVQHFDPIDIVNSLIYFVGCDEVENIICQITVHGMRIVYYYVKRYKKDCSEIRKAVKDWEKFTKHRVDLDLKSWYQATFWVVCFSIYCDPIIC
jgi:hypothetical protein